MVRIRGLYFKLLRRTDCIFCCKFIMRAFLKNMCPLLGSQRKVHILKSYNESVHDELDSLSLLDRNLLTEPLWAMEPKNSCSKRDPLFAEKSFADRFEDQLIGVQSQFPMRSTGKLDSSVSSVFVNGRSVLQSRVSFCMPDPQLLSYVSQLLLSCHIHALRQQKVEFLHNHLVWMPISSETLLANRVEQISQAVFCRELIIFGSSRIICVDTQEKLLWQTCLSRLQLDS